MRYHTNTYNVHVCDNEATESNIHLYLVVLTIKQVSVWL